MLKVAKMNFRNSLCVCLIGLILLSETGTDAAKATRRGGNKAKPTSYNAVGLSYGGGNRPTSHQIQPSRTYQQSHAPSAPALPSSASNNNNARPIGWNVGNSDHNVPQKTVSNTNTGFQPQQHHPQSVQNNPPPSYATHSQYPQQPPAPPSYPHPQNTGFNSHVPAGPPPSYQQPSYPAQHGVPNAGYPQQGTYHQNPAASYPVQQQPSYIPNAQQPCYIPNGQQPGYIPNGQPPVVNNFYGSQQPAAGSSGGSFAKNALLLAGGGLAGAAITSALTPNGETKTVIIHDNATPVPNQPPNQATPAPAPTVQPVPQQAQPVPDVPQAPSIPLAPSIPQATTTGVPGETTTDAQITGVPIARFGPEATNVPLAAFPSTTGPTEPIVPLAPLPENTNATNVDVNAAVTTTTTTTSTSVPLAPFADPSAQAPLKASASQMAMFNITFLTMISFVLAKLI